jgi:dinuclear metal center YbgI/SA1388 family protein
MADRDEILAHAAELLDLHAFRDYGPMGLQVVGAAEVTTVASGVSASLELFERAGQAGADLVLVHHGLFWRNEPLLIDRRLRGRLAALFAGDISLVAYHLALDAHPNVGNNAQLLRRLGIEPERPFGRVGFGGALPTPVGIGELTARVEAAVGRAPVVFAEGHTQITRVAVCTGAAGHDLLAASHEGYDCYVTGEPEEPSLHAARELGIHLIAAGHHASERLGVQALGQLIAEKFDVSYEFVEVENPV